MKRGKSGGKSADKPASKWKRWRKPVSKSGKEVEHNYKDAQMSEYFQALALVLPHRLGPSFFDKKPPTVLGYMLQRSPVISDAASMLSKMSFETMSDRLFVHKALLNLVSVLMAQPDTSSVMKRKRYCFGVEQGLLHTTLRTRDVAYKSAPMGKSLATILQELGAQARRAVVEANLSVEKYKEIDSEGMLVHWEQICQIVQGGYIGDDGSSQDIEMMDTGVVPEVGEGRDNILACRRADAVVEVDDEMIMASYCYTSLARALSVCTLSQQRTSRIAEEVKSLAMNLPDGIYIRYCSGRFDIMKVLMVGPEDTPYENGLFEFDLFCPGNYPNTPPMMTLKTTGGGRVRFNPYLHEGGTICLSLLATLPGEPWRPAQSTLLQVLMSIQAMIFCAEPLLNEPYMEPLSGTPYSEEYTRQVRSYTVNIAIRPWIINPGPIWGEVADRHFRLKGKKIWDTLVVWKEEEPMSEWVNFPADPWDLLDLWGDLYQHLD